SGSLPTRRVGVRISSLEDFPQLPETAGDAAGDRPGRDVERIPDRLIALVTREEAVEDLLTMLGKVSERLVHGEGVVEAFEGVVEVARLELIVRDLLARAGAQVVDAKAAGELRDPGPDRLVLAQPLEMLVSAR